MPFDFTKLDWQQFELLCGALLKAEGAKNLAQFGKIGQPDRGIDWVFEASDGTRCIAQVKFMRGRSFPVSLLRSTAYDLENGLTIANADLAFLIVSVDLTAAAIDQLRLSDRIRVWNASLLSHLLEKHPTVRNAFAAVVASADALQSLVQRSEPSPDLRFTASSLKSRLDSVQPGQDDWREYEDVCIDILNYAFVPPLRLPKIQTSSEDGLDRRDAIYPVASGGVFWESIKYEFSSRLVVAEFKNHANKIGQTEVESLQQYLLPKAKRSLGLLCSRALPSESALKARRRAWMLAENIILFLSDEDLKEIIDVKASEGEPSAVLESQLDEFFVTLAP
jgi:hypothetical protein